MMTTNPHPSRKNLYFLIVFFLLLISQSQFTAGQSVTRAREDFGKLNKTYYANNISAEKYLDSVIRLTGQYWSDGIHFETEELVDLLSLFKEIAWSKKEFSYARLDYYGRFENNASMVGQTGAAMYYADKRSQESKKDGLKYSLREDDFRSQIFAEQGLYNKVTEIYARNKAYLEGLPAQLRNNKVPNVEGMTAISLLANITESYIRIKDTAAVYQTTQLADRIGTAIQKKYPINRQHMLGNDFYMLARQQQLALFEGNQTKVGMLLDSMQKLKITYQDQPTGYIDFNVSQSKIDYYLAAKNVDSASFYIKKFELLPLFLQNQQSIINEYKAELLAIQGNFQESNALLTSALTGERKAKASLMTEMDNLLYAYTEAENAKIELRHSEKIKKQRTLWLVIISSAAAFIILSIYLIMLYRSRKAKSQIEALNNATNMQIISMEEAKHEAVREEQRRLGQDLHDGLSSSIAAIRHQLETLSMDTEDIILKNKLSRLQLTTTNAYEAARRKSHEWFSAADGQQELSFEKQVRLLTDHALPDGRYNKTIHIDDNSLINVDTDTRIALLRIIQEAITNIIKHAKAKNVSILVYEEEHNLIQIISDDGIGLGGRKSGSNKSTIGLDSIRRRIQYLNGKTTINSNAEGTEIIVSIPLASSYTGAHSSSPLSLG